MKVMNVREFRADFTSTTDPVIVLSQGKIIGSWKPGTAGLDAATLARVMGVEVPPAERYDRQPVRAVPKPGRPRTTRDG